MTEVVLDSSAILAQLQGEMGGDLVAGYMPEAFLSAVNLAEVAQKLVNDGATDQGVRDTLADLPCDVVDFDRPMAMRVGILRRTTRERGLSLGDRACLALAERLGLPVLTADRAWADLDLGIEVVLIR
jgi:PIN domain nuclease of toxin-antitoxin system